MHEDILWLIPPYFSVSDFTLNDRASVYPQFTIPYGILSMDSYLKRYSNKKLETSVIDFNLVLKKYMDNDVLEEETRSEFTLQTLFQGELESKLPKRKPKIVGISVLFNSSAGYIQELSRLVKSILPETLVVLGGGMPSAAFKILLKTCVEVDAVCKGEGEKPMLELVNSKDFKKTLETHPSFITRQGLEYGKVPNFDYVIDLDEIPMLDYSLIDLADYNARSIDKVYSYEKNKIEMSIHTSRGCPFSCVFCSNPALHGKDVRMMSIDRVENEIRRMRDEFGMNVLLVEDDHFFHDKERAKEILRRIAKLGIRAEFPNGLAVYAINDEVADLLSKAGVSAVALAVESGSDYVLNKIIKKPLKKKLIKPAVDSLRRAGVKSHVFIVTGLPGEMDEHRLETREMLVSTGFDWVHVFCAIPIHGSRLYDICVENGYITDTQSERFVATTSVIRAPGVEPEKVAKWAYETNLIVNFLENTNVKDGKFGVAEAYFENVYKKYPEHALAVGMLWLVQLRQGKVGFDSELLRKYKELVEEDNEWQSFLNLHKSHLPSELQDVKLSKMLSQR